MRPSALPGLSAIARATDCSIEFSVETESVSHKDSTGGWATVTLGERSGSGTCDMLYEEVTGGFVDLYDKFEAGTAVTLVFGTGVSTTTQYTGTAYITSMRLTGTHKQTATASVTFTFSGAWVNETVA